ncbi:MAG: ABC transporter ATP-binding protein [Candidatus Polarisedimenticolia bacterium]
MIRVEGIAKEYPLGARRTAPGTLGEAAQAFLRSPARVLRRLLGREQRETFRALDDVSFTVGMGEAVGVIGRNGAGKSTLLKVLSRITEPTRGRAELSGRVGSLLEVGTGFHPELTGRENVQLSGALLGMRRAEIRERFDAIVAFAEIDRFLDTPVKHYSSGMYVRLAFAVAAHLDPEILLVDEVLAVGDAPFQRKCLGRMDDAAKEGRTVLFVSHHMPSVTRLCRRAILLEGGRVAEDGDAAAIAARYLRSELGTSAERSWPQPAKAPGDDVARLAAVRVLCDGRVADSVDIRRPVTLEMEYWNFKRGARLLSAFTFMNDQGVHLFVGSDRFGGRPDVPREPGLHRARCTVPGNLFAEGQVRVVAEVSTSHPVLQIHVLEYDSVAFQVVDSGAPGSVRGGWGRPIPGVVRPELQWETSMVAPGPPS